MLTNRAACSSVAFGRENNMQSAMIYKMLAMFYEVHPEMNMTMAMVFITVGMRGVCTQRDVEASVGLTHSTASRNVSWWCTEKIYGKNGIGYIERVEDPTDRRYKLLRLTKKGQQFYERLTRG